MPRSNILFALLFIVLLGLSEAPGRRSLYAFASSSSDGICKSMIETQGYPCQEHKVTTEDGYILSMQRIVVGQSGSKGDKPPVLLQHGVLADAITWVLAPYNKSLPFILADNGYDVWLGNTRGTKYSNGHTSLSTSDKAYWEWSWDELSSYDLHALVQYVYNHTGQKLYYAGHSQGTLIALAAFSQKNLLNMIRSAALFAPIAHLNNIPSPAIQLAARSLLATALYWLKLGEFIPKSQEVRQLIGTICNSSGTNCSDLVKLFTGPSCCISFTTIDTLLLHEPQPTATKNLIHFSQVVSTRKIAKYDYGNPIQNMQHYGQLNPPQYNMASIPKDFPLFLCYGKNDILADVKDVEFLINNDLKDHDKGKLEVVYSEEYGHLDFIMASNAKEVVYEPVLDFFKRT
ncbi:triacylglycerol lipase 2-like [Prosopis cineraria]|uniref:triacylglycerol lipase 2-like n=1 Tax=Prosopis cineraria TaxID=364024 RepID=UPI002410A21D|nr:triacylglycerol lipase 2-like [Prosopis cineraria]